MSGPISQAGPSGTSSREQQRRFVTAEDAEDAEGWTTSAFSASSAVTKAVESQFIASAVAGTPRSCPPLVMRAVPGKARARSRNRGALVRHADVLVKDIRTGWRRVANVHSHRRSVRDGQLYRRIAGDDVAPNHVSGRRREKKNPIDVPADAVVLDEIVAARPHEPDSKVVRCARRRAGDH